MSSFYEPFLLIDIDKPFTSSPAFYFDIGIRYFRIENIPLCKHGHANRAGTF